MIAHILGNFGRLAMINSVILGTARRIVEKRIVYRFVPFLGVGRKLPQRLSIISRRCRGHDHELERSGWCFGAPGRLPIRLDRLHRFEERLRQMRLIQQNEAIVPGDAA